jgi:hypothetical protein
VFLAQLGEHGGNLDAGTAPDSMNQQLLSTY